VAVEGSSRRLRKRIVFRGRELRAEDIERIQGFVGRHPEETRQDIAQRVSRSFGWREPSGRWAVSACRLLLTRLERRGAIELPAPRRRGNFFERRRAVPTAEDAAAGTGAAPGVWERGAPLEVRPIRPVERSAWRQDMARWHYLGDCNLIGESLRYVAQVGSQPIAWLGWAAAALCNAPRDRYIGWNREQKARRLHLVVNNVRFLMLPQAARAGVCASQVLAANVRRLSADWQLAHGHRVLLAETFVDSGRFRGTCYRASNWLDVGETQGFSRRGMRYAPNGCPKAVFVYPLERHARQWLCAAEAWGASRGGGGRAMLDVERIALTGDDGLLALLAGVIDPRKRRGIRHPLLTVLAIAVCGMLSGARNFAAIAQWASELTPEQLRRFGSRRRRPPSEPTIRRVLQSVDAPALDARLGNWTFKHGMLAGQALAIDGKTARGSGDGEHKPFHLVSAVVHGSGLVVAQQRVDDKTNEITSVEPLFEGLDITDAVVSGDAIFTQQSIARFLVEQKHADYLLMLKDNQPTLRHEIESLPREAFSPSGALHRR